MVSASAAPRARRASKPKVKTGCNNCKNRRVKCDEKRPFCTKCVRSGRQCEGYPAYRRTGEAAIPIAPRPREHSSSSISLSSQSSRASPPSRTPPSIASSSTAPSSIASSSPPSTTDGDVVRAFQRARPIASTHVIPKPSQPAYLSPTSYRPGGYAFGEREGQYFQIFRTHTASELSGFFDSEFWTRSVLQESHSEASIRHAVVALGALYKTLEKASESPPGSPESNYSIDTAPNHYNFALVQYGKAITRLRESLQNNETRSQRTILISIVLFTCFQSFTGDHRAAISQIQSGLRLLDEWRHEAKKPPSKRREDVVEDELVQMFTRLAIQAKSYDMAFHFPPPYVIQLSPKPRSSAANSPSSPSDAASTTSLESPQIPDYFTTPKEARSSLDSLCERIMRFNETLSSFYAGPNNILPSSIKSYGLGFRTQLQQWGVAFDQLLQGRRRPGISNTERAGIDVLKMIHAMTSILFLMGFSTSEMDFDGFMLQFREIVELAKEVVVEEELALAQARCGDLNNCRHRDSSYGASQMHFPGMATTYGYRERDSYSHIKASFALDLGIIPPLFVAATKCRDRRLRRDAISLLISTPRREGMWDSLLCGRVAQWIMEVEEEGMSRFEIRDPISTSETVAEDKRVMVKEILFDLQKREATLRCGTRGARENDADPRARETHIFW